MKRIILSVVAVAMILIGGKIVFEDIGSRIPHTYRFDMNSLNILVLGEENEKELISQTARDRYASLKIVVYFGKKVILEAPWSGSSMVGSINGPTNGTSTVQNLMTFGYVFEHPQQTVGYTKYIFIGNIDFNDQILVISENFTEHTEGGEDISHMIMVSGHIVPS